MLIVGTGSQDPSDVCDYDIDFSEWFPTGDPITVVSLAESTAMPTPPSYAIASPVVKVWVYSGGTTGTTYYITVLATTAAGRKKEVDLKIKVKE